MASQYLARLGIVLGVDSGELVQGIEDAKKQFHNFKNQVEKDTKAAAREFEVLKNATDDYGKTLTKVEQIQREIDRGRFMFASQNVKDKLLEQAKAYDAQAASMKKVSGAMTEQQKMQVTYQVTDFVTQIASGQNAMIAFIQQGGQLKDSMGGVGNAFRAVTSLITPMRLALGGLAGSITAVALAYYQGSEESKKFNQAMAVTNQFAGIGIDRFNDLGKAISSGVGIPVSESRQMMQQLVASGQFTVTSLSSVAEAIARVSRLSGESAEAVASKLIPSFDGSAASAKRLNETYHFLTLAQYKQIEALEKQGKAQDAAKLTADFLNDSLKNQEVRLGYLEKLWKGVKDTASDFWDWAKSIGREKDPLREQLDDQIKLMESFVRMGGEGAIKGVRYQEALSEYKRIAALIDAEEEKKRQASEKKVAEKQSIDDYSATGGSDKSMQMRMQLAKTQYATMVEFAKENATDIEKIEIESAQKITDKIYEFESKSAQERRARGGELRAQLKADVDQILAEGSRKIEDLKRKKQWEKDLKEFDQETEIIFRKIREQKKIFDDIAAKRDEQTIAREQLDAKFSLIGATQKEIDLTMSRIEYQKELNKLQRSQEFQNMSDEKQKQAIIELEAIQKAKDANIELAESFRYVQNMYDTVWSNMSSAIETFVRTGKLSIKDFTRSVIQDMLVMNMKLQAMQLVRGLLGSFMAGMNTGSVGNATTMAPGGGYFADGGDPPVGKVSVVGERGPELFVPRTAGTIVPNHALAGMGSTTNVTNNYINAIDAKSFEQRLLESNQTIWSANQYASKNLATNFGRT
jgi:phage-related minor tail protein